MIRPVLVLALLLVGCDKCGASRSDAKPAEAAKPALSNQPWKPPAPEKAEVEFTGDWSAGEVKAAKVVFVAQAEPCLPVPEKPTRYGEETMKAPGDFFAEFFIHQDTRGHVCLYGFDEQGKVVGAASWEKNPLRFFGEGEVVFADIDLTLAAVK